MAELSVKLTTPEDTAWEVSASRVQLPAVAGDITILPSRAPLELMLTSGLLRLMNERAETTKAYFVKGGVAHVASDACLIATEMFVDAKELTVDDAERLANDETLGEEERLFYRVAANKLKTMK